jgi:hypothetical protein
LPFGTLRREDAIAGAAVPELNCLEFLVALAVARDRRALTKDAAFELGANETSSARTRGGRVVDAAARHELDLGRTCLPTIDHQVERGALASGPHYEYGMALQKVPLGFGMSVSGDNTGVWRRSRLTGSAPTCVYVC